MFSPFSFQRLLIGHCWRPAFQAYDITSTYRRCQESRAELSCGSEYVGRKWLKLTLRNGILLSTIALRCHASHLLHMGRHLIVWGFITSDYKV